MDEKVKKGWRVLIREDRCSVVLHSGKVCEVSPSGDYFHFRNIQNQAMWVPTTCLVEILDKGEETK